MKYRISMKKLLLILLGLLMTLPAIARDFEYTYEGQTLAYTVTDEESKTVEIKSCSDAEITVTGAVKVPAVVSDGKTEYTVTRVGDSAFSFCGEITAISLPNTVSSIGQAAFGYCSILSDINIPSGVPAFEYGTFSGCKALTSITIPNSVTSIGFGCFMKAGLTSLKLPDSLTTIDQQAFYGCEQLTSLTIPNSVVEIGDCAFNYCRALTSIAFGSSIKKVGAALFTMSQSLRKGVYPNTIENPFSNFILCRKLASTTPKAHSSKTIAFTVPTRAA